MESAWLYMYEVRLLLCLFDVDDVKSSCVCPALKTGPAVQPRLPPISLHSKSWRIERYLHAARDNSLHVDDLTS